MNFLLVIDISSVGRKKRHGFCSYKISLGKSSDKSICDRVLAMCVQILIPFLVVTCTFSAVHVAVNVPTQSLMLIVLLMSDFMALVSSSSSSSSSSSTGSFGLHFVAL